MSVVTPATTSQGLSGREIPTLDSLYEAAAGVNFTPGWVPRKKRILWSEPRPNPSQKGARAGSARAGIPPLAGHACLLRR